MQRVGFVVFPDYSVIGIATLSVFELANALAGEKIYDARVLSEAGGPVGSSIGMSIDTAPFDDGDFDTVIVGGGMNPVPTSPRLIAFLRGAAAGRARRIAAICIGAFALADAGLLDGRRATTHWFHARTLQARHPSIKVDDDRIFINDGPIWTSAGMTAGIDLALALVESDLGTDAVRAIAKKLVLYHRRAGGQSQFSELL